MIQLITYIEYYYVDVNTSQSDHFHFYDGYKVNNCFEMEKRNIVLGMGEKSKKIKITS